MPDYPSMANQMQAAAGQRQGQVVEPPAWARRFTDWSLRGLGIGPHANVPDTVNDIARHYTGNLFFPMERRDQFKQQQQGVNEQSELIRRLELLRQSKPELFFEPGPLGVGAPDRPVPGLRDPRLGTGQGG